MQISVDPDIGYTENGSVSDKRPLFGMHPEVSGGRPVQVFGG